MPKIQKATLPDGLVWPFLFTVVKNGVTEFYDEQWIVDVNNETFSAG